jgi:hypothetical protein
MPSSVSLANALNITGTSAALQCSFNGGCLFDVNAKGLSTLLIGDPKNNYIKVCDRRCPVDELTSTDSTSKCFVPEVSTTYSNENFKIAESLDDLKSGTYFGTFSDNDKVFDDILTNNPGTSSAPCNVGMAFKEGHIGLVS